MHEIGRIDGRRGLQTGGNVFQICGKTFYDRKNEILMKIPGMERSGIGIIAEFRRILTVFTNQAGGFVLSSVPLAMLCDGWLCHWIYWKARIFAAKNIVAPLRMLCLRMEKKDKSYVCPKYFT
jgi:hypothetical protein